MKKLFKKILCLSFITIIVIVLFTGCGDVREISTKNALLADPFIPIDGQEETGLVYHRDSMTIYIIFKTNNVNGVSYGYLSEYIVNGHNCEYRDDKIYEVIPNYEYSNGKIIEVEPTYKELTCNTSKQAVDEKWNALTEEEKRELLEGR